DRQAIDDLAVVLLGYDIEVDGIRVRVPAPARSCSEQIPDRIDLPLGSERPVHVWQGAGQHVQCIPHLGLAGGVPVWDLELAGAAWLFDLDLAVAVRGLRDVSRARRAAET